MKLNFTTLSGILIITSVLFLSTTTRAQFTGRNGSGPTPISFSFSGTTTTKSNEAAQTANGTSNLANGAVNLNWETVAEQNDGHYEVERSLDGKNFSQIGIILGGFEDGTKTQYAYRDRSDALKNQSVAYYRLKQVDLKGSFSYSSIVPVRLKNLPAGELASK